MQQENATYEKAAAAVKQYTEKKSVRYEASEEEITSLQNEFKEKFSPQILASLDDNDVLNYIFLTADGNNDSLCYYLEFDPDIKRIFGSISGGSSFKFGLFQRQEDKKWTTGAPKAPQILSGEDALNMGKSIRDKIVKSCELIQSRSFSSVKDYEVLDDDLNKILGKFASYAWIQKYFNMIFPDKFIGWYVDDWQKHMLYGFGILPSDKYYGRNGQLALIRKKTPYLSPNFQDICYAMFGDVKHFYRLGSSDDENNYSDEWRKEGVVAVGWKNIGDLIEYMKNGSIDKDKLTDALVNYYYSNDKKTASRKAGEIKTFYETSSSSIITVMDGVHLISFVDQLSPYFYDAGNNMAHRKRGNWYSAFNSSDKLPEDEGLRTTCYEIKKPINLVFLYQKYYRTYNIDDETTPFSTNEELKVNYYTDLKNQFKWNRIIFGAPGTGKSYQLEKDRKEILKRGGDYERVTFHPNYTYSQFVGTYKPISKGKDIYYKFVPGPFLRVLVEAIKSGRTHDPKPYVLIIEEINRAQVAAVFGDVFQLLDRDDKGASQYEIETSEDIRDFLAEPDQLGGEPKYYKRIKLPDNMFIWATMNSADQGVFPMDTAFKRRWDFTYLGVDDNDKDIRDKYVTVGSLEKQRIKWNDLRKAINAFLAELKVNEDKQLGPYFISRSIVVPDGDEIDPDKFAEVFKNKVLMYLFEDAARQRRSDVFKGSARGCNRYSQICQAFDEQGIGIFHENIQNAVEVENLAVNGHATGTSGAYEE